mmetsp:Transcript_95236/g.213298  ORF Transcript_95236/g.213298 Transcript_95236/m.213298 type:complete len:225 (+) Transcript_95236:185-859(+)
MSAILLALGKGTPAVRQMIKKVSPMFLFAAPWNSSTTPCTISAMRLTNCITSSCSTSVAVLKSHMRTLPTMQSTRRPETIAFTPDVSEPLMFCETMFAPASPNPRASNEPSLMMVFSRMTVSINSPLCWRRLQHRNCLIASSARVCWSLFFSADLRISSRLNSASAISVAFNGSSRMASTFSIICSTGVSTRVLASLEKNSEATQSTTHMNTVVSMLRAASRRM